MWNVLLKLCMEGHAIRVIDLRRWNITKERFDQLASDEYKYCMIQTKYLKPNPDDPNALVSAFNFGKQYRFYELPPEKERKRFCGLFPSIIELRSASGILAYSKYRNYIKS